MIDGPQKREPTETPPTVRWAKLIDHESCVGCHACTTACKSENEVPLSVTRTYVKSVDVGTFPNARRAFQVTRCNQCEDAPCVEACPTSAMYQRADGIVDFAKTSCIGCKACIAACPYDAIFINPEDHSAEKCNFCAHRIDVGLEPACVTVCPTQAILVGDLNDPASRVSQMTQREPVAVRRPEKETHPKLFYRGAHQATLDPLAAQRPTGGLFMWSEQATGGQHVVSGYPSEAASGSPGTNNSSTSQGLNPNNSSAAAVLSYDVAHKAPWDWRVSLYTLTKGIAAGAWLVPALFVLFGLLSDTSKLWTVATPVVAGVALAITGALLIWDLEQPKRFVYIFTRAQWRSWLVRGAYIIAGFSAVLGVHFVGGQLDRPGWIRFALIPGLPLAAMTAVYTAYLFAQAKARDLWQNPLLPPHLLVQTLMAGSAILAPVAVWLDPAVAKPMLWTLWGSTLVHLLMVMGETTLPHGTAHARLAVREMTRGRFRGFFWMGIVLAGATLVAGWIAIGPTVSVSVTAVAGLLALAALFSFEHAYVQAGQAVPLA